MVSISKTDGNRKFGIHLLLVCAFAWMGAGAYAPFISAYYNLKGLDAVAIGTLLSIGPVMSLMCQPMFAWISDKTGKRKTVFMIVVAGAAVTAWLYYLGNSYYFFFLATVIYSAFYTAINPLGDAINIKLCNENNIKFSIVRMGGTVGYALIVFVAGFYLNRNPSAQFALASIVYLVLFLLIWRLKIPEHQKQKSRDKTPKGEVPIKSKGLFKSNEGYFVLAFAFISQLGLSFLGGFMGVYVLELGYTRSLIGIFSCISALSEVPTLFVINKVIQKVKVMHLLMMSCLLMNLRLFLFSTGAMPMMVVAQLMQSVTYMTIYYSCAMYMSKNVIEGKEALGQSSIAMVQAGLGAIAGNIMGGYIIKSMGTAQAYMAVSGILLCGTALIALLYGLYKKSSGTVKQH